MTTPHLQPNPTSYVLGFAFSHTFRSVVLIEKQKPAWQAGKLNGVGGKIDPTDRAPEYAMAREFLEETGCPVMPAQWRCFEVMKFLNGARVWCFATVLPENAIVRTMEAEKVDAYPIDEFNGTLRSELEVIPNLNWLIPKAYHEIRQPSEERLVL